MNTVIPQQDHIRALLNCVPIQRVISVDDRHTPEMNVVITLARDLPGELRAELLGEPDKAEIYNEHELFEKQLEALWSELQPARQTELVQRVQEMADQSEVVDDTEALSKLKQLMPEDAFEALSMDDWKARRDEIVNSNEAVLVLFDRDFSAEGGREDDGEALMADLQQASEGKPIWAGLLTHTVTPKEEHATYRALGERLDLHRTVVISKARISEGTLPSHLRLTLLAPLMRRLVEIVAGQISTTHQAAIDEALGVLPVELESMVFGASRSEGVREVDTLLLLFGLIQRDQARASIWNESEVHELTQKIRCLGQVEIGDPVADVDADDEDDSDGGGVQPQDSGDVRFFQRRQIYEDGDLINRMHLPIECGDIFEDAASSSKKWVVIAQPCDLMVRNDGQRGAFPIAHVVMAPVRREAKNSALQPGDFRLPYFDGGQAYVAKLARARYQRVWLLDLAVFREDGRATLSLDDEPAANMLDGWGGRHARLAEQLRQILEVCARSTEGLEKALGLESPPGEDHIQALANSVQTEIATDHADPPFVTALDPTAGSIDAGCRRVGRLSPDYGRALLARWGGHIARPVLPYDLERQPQ